MCNRHIFSKSKNAVPVSDTLLQAPSRYLQHRLPVPSEPHLHVVCSAGPAIFQLFPTDLEPQPIYIFSFSPPGSSTSDPPRLGSPTLWTSPSGPVSETSYLSSLGSVTGQRQRANLQPGASGFILTAWKELLESVGH